MATKIRRCLYIGLGGTGMTALLHTKRMFIDTYGEVPPMIGFLGIDTDGGVYNRVLESKYGEVKIDPSDQMPIKVHDARPIYNVNQERLTWVPERNLRALSSMVNGAGQVRSNGRFALTVNYDKVAIKVRDKINQITSASHVDNPNYSLLADAQVEIHMVFSLAGGTGSGTFINMAYLLKKELPDCKLIGYAVLPDVFEAMSPTTMPNVKANGYGAIKDLDWFMHRTMGQDEFYMAYLRNDQKIDYRPFNSVVFVNNRNENGDTYDHVNQLAEMISLALVTSAGELSAAAASVSDNLERCITDGTMDIEQKMAWAGGMGASEIIFRGADLGEVYALKAANYVIENLLNTCVDTDVIVNHWIDELQIRENNGYDNVIDYILKKTPDYNMADINDVQNALNEAAAYVETQVPADDKLNVKLQELKDKVGPAFHDLMVKEINKECGIGSAEKILLGLTAQFDVMMGEMKAEREDWIRKERNADQVVKSAVADLADYDKRFIKSKSTLSSKKQDVMDAAYNHAIAKREIKRRDKAIEFYTFMNSLILDETETLRTIKQKVEDVYRENTDRIAQIQNRVNSDHQLFQIDLAQDKMGNVSIDTSQINFNNLLISMSDGDKVHNFGAMTNKEVADILLKYTSSLNGAQKWTKMSLDEVLNEMEEPEFDRILAQTVRKSLPLFTYDLQGYQQAQDAVDIIFVGVPSKESRITKEALKNHFPGTATIDQSVIGMKDRVIIYHQIGVVPAFTISSLSQYLVKYEEGNIDYHIDAQLETKMERDGFNLWPMKSADNSLELWVKGIIFGLIKNEDDCYWYIDTEHGDPLYGNWVQLKKYRDEAFAEFRLNRSAIERQYEDFFDKLQRERGINYLNEKVAEAKQGDNYLTKISQINMTREQLTQKGFEPIRKQITNEITYVQREL